MSYYRFLLLRKQWKEKRLKILERDGNVCTDCHADEAHLHVHHIFYVKGRKPWEYPDWALETLCESCHTAAHEERTIPKFDEMPPQGTYPLISKDI